MKKVFIIAGEVSGDVLGGGLMRAARGKFEFVGIGGDCMAAAGLKTLFPISDLSVMGAVEVLMKARTLTRRIGRTAAAIIKEKPDVVLTIDAPSFAIRVIKKVKERIPRSRPRRGRTNSEFRIPKFYHVVAPMVWAWGPWRAKKYARIFDKMFCFFDFERSYFTKYGLPTTAIGHPIYNMIKAGAKKTGAKPAAKKYIALLPGSRMAEAARMMPVFRRVAEKMPDCDFAIPTTETTGRFVMREIETWARKPKIFSFNDRRKLYLTADAAVAKSGTGTVELAVMGVPTVVVYKTNWLTELLVRIMSRIKYASLVNILAGREIFPELLGRRARAENIIRELKTMNRKKIIAELRAADRLWHKSKAPMKIVVDGI